MAKKSKREPINPDDERKKFFLESKFVPNNQKYGLFSYTGTLAISQRPYFNQTLSHRGTDGLVMTGPKNLYTSPARKGKTFDVYFSPPAYYSDNYNETAKPYLKDKLNADGMRKNHQVSWKPGGKLNEPYSLFPDEPTEREKKSNKRGPDGEVLLGPRNFYTSPMKKGIPSCTPGLLIGQSNEHIPDPYNRKKELEFEEHKKHKSKMQSEAFKGMDPGGRDFWKNEELYGGDFSDRKQKTFKSEKKISVPFYSIVSKTKDCFNDFPEYKPDERVQPKKEPPSDKPKWKSTVNLRTIPSPSITCSSRNLRKEFAILRRN